MAVHPRRSRHAFGILRADVVQRIPNVVQQMHPTNIVKAQCVIWAVVHMVIQVRVRADVEQRILQDVRYLCV